MKIVMRYFDSHKLDISTTKSKIMDSDGQEGKACFNLDEHDPLELDRVLSFKYLGIPLSCAPHKFFSDYNEQVKKRAHSFL